jgi:hypothetical protein
MADCAFAQARSISLGAFLALTATLMPGCSHANGVTPGPSAPPVQTVGDQGPSGLALPKLAGVAAPAWAKVGLRLTYKVDTATIAGMGANWKEDPDGIWKTEDGRRWSPGEKGGVAAQGYLQVDVIAMPTGAAVAYASFYLVPKAGATPTLSFSYPVIGQAANAGGLWVNPAELKKAKIVDKGDLKVIRMPYTIGGQARPAVWIESNVEQSRLVYVYDEESGVLLHDATAVEGKESPVMGKNEVSNTPSTTLSSGTLVAQRVVVYPWAGEDATSWSASPEPMTYKGTTSVPTAGGAPLVLGQELAVTPQGSGPGWIRYSCMLKTVNPLTPPTSSPSETISGLGQFGGAWLPPAALGRLTKGQQLDRDPVTQVTVSVSSVTSDRVMISATSPTQTLRWGYDKRTGKMVVIERDDQGPFGPIKTRMALVGG